MVENCKVSIPGLFLRKRHTMNCTPIFKKPFHLNFWILKKTLTADTLGGKENELVSYFFFYMKHKLTKIFQTHVHTVTCMLTLS